MSTFIRFFSLLGLSCIIIQGCQSPNAESNTSASNTQQQVDEPSVDILAPSDSKGIGKFTDVKVGNTIDKEMATAGESVFQMKCVSCHSSGTERLIGPGLKGITKIRTAEWIMNMTYNSEEMTNKDPVAKALKKEYKLPMMISGGITDEECRQVLEFLRKTDLQQN